MIKKTANKLIKYQKKRKFNETPEPAGEKESDRNKGIAFVIQEHRASHLHYDLRLELGGVLKSWAIPKGPSLNPKEKRMATAVEDHPYDYKNFEGIIPEGNYGSGEVIIWDEGNYYPMGEHSLADYEKIIQKELENGHLSICFNGKKIKGEFALVKMKNRGDNWLLIKANDQYSSSENILEKNQSVRSKRTIEDIKDENNVENLLGDVLGRAKKEAIPKAIAPMFATLIGKPFDDKSWIFEVKWDGYRTICFKEGNSVILKSRNDKVLNVRFQPIYEECLRLPTDCVLDGEVVALDRSGKPNFSLLQDVNLSSNLVYFVFDVLYFNHYNLLPLPLSDRRRVLEKIFKDFVSKKIKISIIFPENGNSFFRIVQKEGLEGIIAKKKTSIYRPGARSRDWLKIKTHLQQEVVIGGYELSKNRSFSSLLMGVYIDHTLSYIGHVGSGFNQKIIDKLKDKLEKLRQTTSPFINPPENKNIVWVSPRIVCEVKFQEWTRDNLMRQPVFIGLRDDIEPATVHLEKTR